MTKEEKIDVWVKILVSFPIVFFYQSLRSWQDFLLGFFLIPIAYIVYKNIQRKIFIKNGPIYKGTIVNCKFENIDNSETDLLLSVKLNNFDDSIMEIRISSSEKFKVGNAIKFVKRDTKYFIVDARTEVWSLVRICFFSSIAILIITYIKLRT